MKELYKALPLALIAAAFLYATPNLPVFLEAVGLMGLFGVAAHFLCKIFFFGHNVDELFNAVIGNDSDPSKRMPAAIVYAAIVFFLAQVVTAGMVYLKG